MALTEKEKTEKFNEVLKRISEGESVTSILKVGNDIISKPIFFEWLAGDPIKANQYARACEVRADNVFEEILEIADDGRNDTYVDEDGNTRTDYDVIARSKLRVDARKWMLSKMNPKKYGDRIENNHSGEVGITWNEIKNYEPDNKTD